MANQKHPRRATSARHGSHLDRQRERERRRRRTRQLVKALGAGHPIELVTLAEGPVTS
jgi:hypothetical protein